MERWFDLHLYLANWGTRRLMIRLPNGLIDQAQLERFIGEVDYARHWVAGEHLILDILFEDVGIDEEEDWRDDTHWLSVLGGLRDDLLAGDLRMLYLLWMAAIEYDAFEDDQPEPMPGIGPMTGALVAFVNFFHIDPDLVAAAAERPATTIPRAFTAESARAVVSPLSDEEKIGLLIRVDEGDLNLAAKLRSDISRRLEPLRDVSNAVPRTVGELCARAVEIRSARASEAAATEARLREQQQREVEDIRRSRLAMIERKGDRVWDEIETAIARRNTSGYDEAERLLVDLKAIATKNQTSDAFRRRVDCMRARHATKRKFVERLETSS